VDKESGKPLYWTLKVKNATHAVALDGTLEDALSGAPGLSIGCHLSNVTTRNRRSLSHPCLIAAFTKSVALIVTKITDGRPSHCVRYRHSYGNYVDLNDTKSKKLFRDHPELAERQFMLRPYITAKPHWKEEYGRKQTGKRKRPYMMRGDLARMVKANLVHSGVRRGLEEVA